MRFKLGKTLSVVVVAAILIAAPANSFAAKKLDGRWAITVTFPESPASSTSLTYSAIIDASPRDGSLHGRLTVTDEQGRTVAGAWRQSGKKVSITYELPCVEGGPCASLILTAKIKGGGLQLKKGKVIVMWDTPNENNPALFDTSKGSFSGMRLE